MCEQEGFISGGPESFKEIVSFRYMRDTRGNAFLQEMAKMTWAKRRKEAALVSVVEIKRKITRFTPLPITNIFHKFCFSPACWFVSYRDPLVFIHTVEVLESLASSSVFFFIGLQISYYLSSIYFSNLTFVLAFNLNLFPMYLCS